MIKKHYAIYDGTILNGGQPLYSFEELTNYIDVTYKLNVFEDVSKLSYITIVDDVMTSITTYKLTEDKINAIEI
jgi:hypothetical protein